jgi:hypothetical protein
MVVALNGPRKEAWGYESFFGCCSLPLSWLNGVLDNPLRNCRYYPVLVAP